MLSNPTNDRIVVPPEKLRFLSNMVLQPEDRAMLITPVDTMAGHVVPIQQVKDALARARK